MSDRYKILAAARKMQSFTAESLAAYAQVTRDNVYKVVLDRDKRFFEKVDAARGKRGRPVANFRVKPEAIESLTQEVSSFQADLGILRIATLEHAGPGDEVTPDLLAAESYLLDQFPQAESREEKAEILRDAIRHLNNDCQLVPLAMRSPRRKVDNALLNLSFDELAAEQIVPYRAYAVGEAELYHHAKAGRILYDIVSEMISLPAELQQDVARRLKTSPLLARAIPAPVPQGEIAIPLVRDREMSLTSVREPYAIEFLTPNRVDPTLVQVAVELANAIEPCGIRLDVRQYDTPRDCGDVRPLMSIVGCNSANPSNKPPNEAELLRDADITYVADVSFRSELRDLVLRSGRQYLSNVATMDMDFLLAAMQPLPQVINECRLLREIGEKDNWPPQHGGGP